MRSTLERRAATREARRDHDVGGVLLDESSELLRRAGERHRQHRGDERLGAVPRGGDEPHGVAGRVREIVAAEGLEAGEQHGRHRFSLGKDDCARRGRWARWHSLNSPHGQGLR